MIHIREKELLNKKILKLNKKINKLSLKQKKLEDLKQSYKYALRQLNW